jgi:hypothetical protein
LFDYAVATAIPWIAGQVKGTALRYNLTCALTGERIPEAARSKLAGATAPTLGIRDNAI